MTEHLGIFLHKLRFVLIGVIIIADLFLLSLLLPAIDSHNANAGTAQSAASTQLITVSDSPNLVTTSLGTAINNFGQAAQSTGRALGSALHTTTSVAAQTGKTLGRIAGTAVRGIGSGIAAIGYGISRGVVAVLSVPQNIVGSFIHAPAVSSVIRPADQEEIPIIDPNSPELRAALTALPAASPKSPAKKGGGPAWPIHGAITTLFGESDWPYQVTHTGIDISDGKVPGTTPIHPFRPGRVLEVVHSYAGLGNHVVIDHGKGVTSVYAHLNSTAVRVGQDVDMKTVLGYEGTTGASTGTHLHFEIRVNGQATNPMQFIPGRP